MGRPLQVLRLSELKRAQLQTYAQSRALPAGLVSRATVILLAAEGLPNADIAAQLGLAPVTVGNYRRRWLAHGLAGLYDAPRDGRPRTHDDDAVARLLRKVLRTKPTTHTQWSVRTVARPAATRPHNKYAYSRNVGRVVRSHPDQSSHSASRI